LGRTPQPLQLMKLKAFWKTYLGKTLLGSAIVLSSCSFMTDSFVRQARQVGGEATYAAVTDAGETHQPAFLRSFSSMAQSGISFTIDEASVKLGSNLNNILSIANPDKAMGSFYIHGLSLHGIHLDVHLPLDYNGFSRGLDLTLTDETLYFNLFNLDADTYDVRYKVGIAPYDTEVAGSSVDGETGGYYRYEYGDLDWMLDDILETLSGLNLKIDKTRSETSVNTKDILESLENIEEGTYGGKPYFVWNLPVGEKVYPLGFRANASYQWTGIDFPSKSLGEAAEFALSDDATIKLSASIYSNPDCHIEAPADADSYQDLVDSLGLIHRVCDYAGNLRFSVKTGEEGLIIGHYEEAINGGMYGFNRPEINETAVINLDADIDFTDKILGDTYVDLAYTYATATQNLHILVTGDGENAYEEIYASLNSLVKAKTSKTVIDAVAGSFQDILNDEDVKNSNFQGLLPITGTLFDAIDAVKASRVVTGMQDGHYENIMEAISYVEASANTIVVRVDLTTLGASGNIIITLTGNGASLARVEFDQAALGPFSFDGTILIGEYDRVPMTDEQKAEYKELRHLESVADQLARIAESDQLTGTVDGWVLKNGTSSVVTNGVQVGNRSADRRQGFTISGTFGFDLAAKKGTGTALIVDRKEDYVNDHNVMIDVTGAEPKDEEGEVYQTDDEAAASNSADFQWMLFEYNSKNNSKPSGENRSDPNNDPICGRISIHSLNGVIKTFAELLNSDDPRFERLIRLIYFWDAESMIDHFIDGRYFAMMSHDLFEYIDLGARKDEFRLPADILGVQSPLDIIVTYKEDVNKDNLDGTSRTIGGCIESIEIAMSFKGKSDIYFMITLGDPVMPEMHWPNPTITNFVNYSSLKTLAEYGLGMFQLGEQHTDSQGNIRFFSGYHIQGNIHLSIPIASDIDIDINAFVRVEGADIRIMGLFSLPIKSLLKLNSKSLVKGGSRYTMFYMHLSDQDEEGSVYIHRYDLYGHDYSSTETSMSLSGDYTGDTSVEDYEFKTRLTWQTFKSDILGFILKDILGMGTIITDNLESTSSSGGSAYHGEDIIKSLTYTGPADNATWNAVIGTSALAHTSSTLLGDLNLTLKGIKNNNNEKTINQVSGSMNILGGVLGVTLDASITNITTAGYHYCWDDTFQYAPKQMSASVSGWLVKTTNLTLTRQNRAASLIYGDELMTFDEDGNFTLAPSFAALPFSTTPNSHV